MKTISIQTASKTYPVFIGENAYKGISTFIQQMNPHVSRILIISDRNVANQYMAELQKELQPLNVEAAAYILPSGDQEKSFENYYDCQTFALNAGLDRKSLIIALGGGMIGDFAGFVAGTFMRGIRFIQVPTTLLAHDSAVGGKTGINHPAGKNMIGVFHQPEGVFYSLNFLQSLPEREWRSGFAEVIKHSLIGKDPSFYRWLKQNVSKLAHLRGEILETALLQAIQVKADVVLQDEKESGLRAILNFGHTLGHALEAELGYGNMSHGDAVAAGMRFALLLSEKVYEKDLSYSSFAKWLDSFGYPRIPSSVSANRLLKRMTRDKKSEDGEVHMVLLHSIGHAEVLKIDKELLQHSLEIFLENEQVNAN